MRTLFILTSCFTMAACGSADLSEGTSSEAATGQPSANDDGLASTSSGAAVNCVLSPSSPKGTLIKCTMQHQEFKGIGGVPNGVVTRVFGVFIPKGYVAGKSGMILKIQGTTHQIASDCSTGPAVSESSGWLPFLQTVPSPAPVMVCPEGWFDTGGTDNGERYNVWGYHQWNYVNGVLPNDVDFLAKVVTSVQSALQLDPKFMAVTNDWYVLGSIMANEFAAAHPELVSSVALYNDGTFTRVAGSVAGTLKDTDGTTIAPPKGPVHYMNIASGSLSSPTTSICGKTPARVLNADDIVAYWAQANKPTSFSYGDLSGNSTKFCTGQFNPSTGMGIGTTLEKLVATSRTTGKDIAVYKLVGNARGTPVCSFNFQGQSDPTICASTNPPIDFRVPPADCTWKHPCNHFLSAPSHHLLGALYEFMSTHKMP